MIQKYNNKELSEILNKFTDEMKNNLIRVLMENDRENVSIVEEPIYDYMMDKNGAIIGRKPIPNKYSYGFSVTHKAEEYREYDFIYEISYVDKDYAYHIVEANKNNFEETIYKIFANGGFEVEIACIEK